MEELKETHGLLLEAVGKLEDRQLKQKIRARKYSTYFLLHGLVHHAAYHAGQIALLKKALAKKR